ncbi:cupin domain-containing protein [Deinococcus pimensis]|uniref:cupin domain-containing protein n=1 Tax=Deinococcus pimensis TaxID=309888 RepID=UPI0004B147DA|nr:cupin domain-containing protein [Deinococcus pimensis]
MSDASLPRDAAQAVVSHPGERHVLTFGACRIAYVHADTSEDTTLLELLLPAAFDEWPRLTFHEVRVTYFVVSGRMTYTCGGRGVALALPETSLVVPAGCSHRIGTPDDGDAHVLLIARHAGLRQYFEALAALRARSREWPPRPPEPLAVLDRRYNVSRNDP